MNNKTSDDLLVTLEKIRVNEFNKISNNIVTQIILIEKDNSTKNSSTEKIKKIEQLINENKELIVDSFGGE